MRRRGEPDLPRLLRFIADHESLTLTQDEFPTFSDERLREVIRALADEITPKRPAKPKSPAPVGSGLKVVLHTDGASRGNPGPAGAGWILSTGDGKPLADGGAFLGHRTNNEAEYEAVIGGLEAAAELGAEEVCLNSDSELLVRQINGRYQVKNARLQKLHAMARELIHRFRRFQARHIPRDQNRRADARANLAIDESSQ